MRRHLSAGTAPHATLLSTYWKRKALWKKWWMLTFTPEHPSESNKKCCCKSIQKIGESARRLNKRRPGGFPAKTLALRTAGSALFVRCQVRHLFTFRISPSGKVAGRTQIPEAFVDHKL